MAEINYEAFNDAVKSWGKQNTVLLKEAAGSMGIIHRPRSPSPTASIPKIKESVGYTNKVINRVSFKFPKSLVFTHRGAGKGMGGSKGSRWIDKDGNTKKTNPESLGKMGTGNRTPKPFF